MTWGQPVILAGCPHEGGRALLARDLSVLGQHGSTSVEGVEVLLGGTASADV